MPNQREIRSLIAVQRAAHGIRYQAIQAEIARLTRAIEGALTRRVIVGYRRYRGPAALEAGRRYFGDAYRGGPGIVAIPRYETRAPPPGLARALAIQLI